MANLNSFSANYGFNEISQYELLFSCMNKIENDFNSLLPDELERIKKVVDNLITVKENKKLTNQQYQIKYLNVACPRCKSSNIKRNGHKNGTQRYLCKDCNKSFSITTNTILNHTKIKYWQLMKMIKCILNNMPLSNISKEIKLSQTDTYYLEIKIFNALDNAYNDIILKGVVQADEKYFRLNFKGTKKSKMPRKSKQSGSQNLKIGTNKELSCVVVAIDENDNLIIKVVGNGPASTEMIEKALNGKIEPNSILVTDSKSSYIKFAEHNNLILKQIPDGLHKTKDGYSIGEVNEITSELETYINSIKRGVSTKHLQQYCNFIKYKKILKYTYEYLDRNKEMYKDAVILTNTLTNDDISKMEMPFPINDVFS